MSFLGPDAPAVAGPVARLALLAWFDFVGDPRWYWTGFGPLRTSGGQIWEGTAGLATISGLSVPIGTAAQQASFGLSGVDPRVIALARQQSAKVKGRDCSVYLQLFNEDWSLRGPVRHVWSGLLDVMTYKMEAGGTYSVDLTAENLWAGRRKPPHGYYTDADQQARFPGDLGCQYVASLPGKTINWPG